MESNETTPLRVRKHHSPARSLMILAVVSWAGWATAQQPANLKSSIHSSEEPIDIKSEQLIVQQKQRIAEFSGQVQVVKGELIIHCDRLRVSYSDSSQSNSNASEITKMIFTGSVSIEQRQRRGLCDNAEYDRKKECIVCTGNPWVMEGENRITGKQIVYWLDRDEVEVTDPRAKIHLSQEDKKGGSKP